MGAGPEQQVQRKGSARQCCQVALLLSLCWLGGAKRQGMSEREAAGAAVEDEGGAALGQPLTYVPMGEEIREEEGEEAEKEAPKNNDRISCLRHDDLDLVKPLTPEHIIRMLVPIGTTTNKDVYLSINSFWLKRLSLEVHFRRGKGATFEIEVRGTDTFQGTPGVAAIDFWLDGIDILLRDSWMDWGAGWAADRGQLNEGQSGNLRFKLLGTGHSVKDPETGAWEVQLLEKTTHPFKIEIEKQWLLGKVLNNFGGLDGVIMNNLWPTIAKLVPRSLTASLNFLSNDELGMEITAIISGSQSSKNAPLEVQVETKFELTTVPGKMIQVFLEHFDPKEIAEDNMMRLLEEHDLNEMWEANKPALKATLKRYGIVLDTYEEKLDLEDLRQRLIQAAKDSADIAARALKPFARAQERGEVDFFDGLAGEFVATAKWNKADPDAGKMHVKMEPPSGKSASEEFHEHWRVPKNFIAAFGLGRRFFGPRPGDQPTHMEVSNMSYEGAQLKCDLVRIQNFRHRSGDENATNLTSHRTSGKVRDVLLKLPAAWDPLWKVSLPHAELRHLPTGDILANVAEGVQADQLAQKKAPEAAQQPAKPRKGPLDSLAGPLPEELARPTRAVPTVDLPDLAPSVRARAGIWLSGQANGLRLTVQSKANASVNIGAAMRSSMAGRPKQDFGYTFYSGRFSRKLSGGEAGVPEESTVIALVSCGYLRLFKEDLSPDKANPFSPVDFVPSNGQLELDLTQYAAEGPRAVGGEGSQAPRCLELYSGGYAARPVSHGWFGSATTAKELLCGPEAEVAKLKGAIDLQVKRFRNEWARSTDWNFGTHLNVDDEGAEVPQFLLAPGRETTPLMEILKR